MSRWREQSEDPSFQQHWKELKSVVLAARVNDGSQMLAVSELARLRKVILYIEGILKGLDPELLPLSTWESFKDQADQCASQTAAFVQSQNPAHIQRANNAADNLLAYVRPYMIVSGKVGNALKAAAKEYSDAYKSHAESYVKIAEDLAAKARSQVDAAVENSAKIEDEKKRIVKANELLFGIDDVGGEVPRILEQAAEIDEKFRAISNFHNALFVGTGAPPLSKSISDAAVAAAKDRNKITTLVQSIKAQVAELGEFYEKTFGVEDEAGQRKGGLSDELDNQKRKMLSFEEEQKRKYGALNQQIESLLPGATNAGLAGAYKEVKDSFEGPIRFASRVFFSAIAALIAVSIILSVQSFSLGEIQFVEIKDWSDVLRDFAHKIPYYIPLVWLAYFASKRRSEYQRLQQEYAHKEALAKSYDSYKKQISDLGEGNAELQKALLLNAIEAISRNASETLDGVHGDKAPAHAVAEQAFKVLDSPGVVDRLKKKLGL